MKFVYLVFRTDGYEFNSFEGAYSSRELAFVGANKLTLEGEDHYIEILKCNIDDPDDMDGGWEWITTDYRKNPLRIS